MKGPKIIVFHIRQLFRTGAFVLAGLVVILLLIWALMPKSDGGQGPAASLPGGGAEALFIPGEYSSYIVLDSTPIYVTVEVDQDKITDVRLSNLQESQDQLYPLFRPVMETLKADILEYQTTELELPTEVTQTGQVLLSAINIALSQAYANVITTGF
ncbi:MAG: hypothetical protein LBS19_10680 [Clostridiales bacterium]|jgi:uncharacterized protein with FMN-binding domain|nr:hypothetical protein [Clostridiales bacterium]